MGSMFRLEADALVLTVPAEGIGADCLARPLSELGLAADAAAPVLRVDAPPTWRWSTLDAAFLAGVVGDLERHAPVREVRGVPKELQSLLDLSRAGPLASQACPTCVSQIGRNCSSRGIRLLMRKVKSWSRGNLGSGAAKARGGSLRSHQGRPSASATSRSGTPS